MKPNANLFSRLFDNLDDPTRLAIETPDGTLFSFGGLIEQSGRIANVLTARGVKAGDRVVAQIEKSPNWVAVFLATLRTGAIYLPLNPAFTFAEVEYFVTDAEASLILCDPAKASGIEALAAKVGARIETLDANDGGSLAAAC